LDRTKLAVKVRAGEISANTVAIKAGFRRKLTPFARLRADPLVAASF